MAGKKALRNLVRIAPIIVAAVLAAGAAAQNAQSAVVKPDTRTQVAGRWKSPNEVYLKICSHCHDTGVGPVLKGRELAFALTIAAVRIGPGAMPAFRQTDVDDAMLKRLAEMLSHSKAAESSNPEAKK